ncbi:hepatocyte growth factor activator isoform X1 [Alosa sapidissima]|uniref:hepatocyte growth factor activator isoform X1 n=1 Tax=Alosa sapidissima TaxID=34773 RepID=UPI001C095328|nr:hepatocyte growth factor activator isoform X1 [Alosa sapidissima]
MGKDHQTSTVWIHFPNTWDQAYRFLTTSIFTVILLPCVFSLRTRMVPPGHEIILARDAVKESLKVLTIDGKECKFPFRLGGTVYHQCVSLSSTRPWCSLTHNFDRDGQWGYCITENDHPNEIRPVSRREPDPCAGQPCWNGGLCTRVMHKRTFDCTCPEGFSGRRCEERKCFEETHLRYYDSGDSWGRIANRLVEQCSCLDGKTLCESTRYTGCSWNPCENEGTCRMIEDTGEEVCACRSGYSGPFCSIVPDSRCYQGNGTDYRGIVNTTKSGTRCLPWNSDLLFDELSLDRAKDKDLKGLGEHAFCRNPDKDGMPWCYTMQDGAVSWEYCDIPACFRVPTSRRVVPMPPRERPAPSPTNLLRPIRPNKCGTRHKKRIPRGRILGGTSALPGSHPWMAGIYIGEEFCGGTLIHACWVVSAAHCFSRNPRKSKIKVVLGQHFFNDTGPNARSFGVENYFFPPTYNQFEPTRHDIVLLKLEKKDGRCARRSPFIRPICLPEKNTTFPDFYCCQITGWGHTAEKGTTYSHLREGVVGIYPFDWCSRPEVYGPEIRPGMLCAGSNRCVDACQKSLFLFLPVSGRLGWSVGLHARWSQHPVRSDQLGGRLWTEEQAWRLHQSRRLRQLDH